MDNTLRRFTRSLLIGLLTILVVLTSGCAGPTPSASDPAGSAATPCDLGDLFAPEAVYPADDTIILELTPAMQWVGPEDCDPDGFHVEVTTYGGYGYGTTITSDTSGGVSTWTTYSALEPATDYEWRVAAVAGGDLGPYSESTRFWTGPICETVSLAAPELHSPVDGAVITTDYVVLDWTYPDPCVPEDYLAELKADPGFVGPNLMSEAGIAPADEQVSFSGLEDCSIYYWRVSAHNGSTSGPYSEVRQIHTDFMDSCEAEPSVSATQAATHEPEQSSETMVSARQDSNCRKGPGTVYDQYGFLLQGETALAVGRLADNTWLVVQLGDRPLSCWIAANLLEFTFSFEDLPGTLAPPTPTPASSGIQGLVWHDLCAPPWHTASGTSTPPPPSGCIQFSDGGMEANGIYESGEPGIPGVKVRLGAGACPSSGLAVTTSGGSGGYSFTALSPGTYCVSIDALDTTNVNILIPGGWTYPGTGPVAQTTVNLNPGDTASGISFGWDYQFLPSP